MADVDLDALASPSEMSGLEDCLSCSTAFLLASVVCRVLAGALSTLWQTRARACASQGDGVEILIITKDGVRREEMPLKKD